MKGVFICPRCKKGNEIPDDSKSGDIHKCKFCGQLVRLRNYMGFRITTTDGE